MAFTVVYSKTTGIKQRIPEEWLTHPVLGRDFRKTPLTEKQQRDASNGVTTIDPPTDGDKEK
jgi:hypothetical protein